MEVKDSERLQQVGECIYCGSSVALTDEHIVPYALGGRLILPKASCSPCARITAEVERRVLRGFMHRARIVGDFPTRRPKERPGKLNVQLLQGNLPLSVQIPSAKAPVFLQLPTLAPPAFLSDQRTATGVVIVGIETLLFGSSPEQIAQEFGASAIRQTDNLDATALVRMLAKIGYSYFVGVRGLVDRSAVPVLPLILGRSDDGSHWVGSAVFETEAEKRGAIHVLSLVDGVLAREREVESVTVARVKLFASAGATGYEIVVRRQPAP